MSMLIQNSIYIPEDDAYLVSTHRHDFRCHKYRDNKEICIDGGCGVDSYARRAGDLFTLDEAGRYQEYCLNSDEPFEGRIAERLLWGSAGKDGTEPMTFRPIKEWAYKDGGVDHLRNILKNVANLSLVHRRVIEYWLAKREAETEQPLPSP